MQQPPYSNSTPVNGTLILILGILSLIGFPFLGPVAWFMGNKGLSTIDSGFGDPVQRQNTTIGRICGIIGTVVLILGVLATIAWFAFFGALLTHSMNQQGSGALSKAHKVTKSHGSASLGYYDVTSAITANDEAKVKAIARKNRAALNARNAQGETPIFLAVTNGKPAMVGLLLRLGAAVNAKDMTGATPVDKAHTLGKDDVLAVLVGHGGKSGRG